MSFESGVETFVGLGTISETCFSLGFSNAAYSPLLATNIYSNSKIETGLRLKEIEKNREDRTIGNIFFKLLGQMKNREICPTLISNLQNGNQFLIRTPNFEIGENNTLDVASEIIFKLENRRNCFAYIGIEKGKM